MTSPDNSTNLLQPPHPAMHNEIDVMYKFLYELWFRSGGLKSGTPNLKDLQASVNELNSLAGLNTENSVQEHLDLKAEIDDFGRTEVVDTTSIGNIGTGEDTLISYSINSNTLGTDNNYLEVSAWGTVAANANNKTIKLKLGSTTLLTTGAVAANSGSWAITSTIVRIGESTQQCISSIASDNSLILDSSSFIVATEDLSTSLDIFCTGEATTNDDIIQKGLIVKWFN